MSKTGEAINKCNNEKRRREQENIYIEELAELISANFADMSSLSVKPDKCAILQETVNQIRNVKQLENSSSGGGGGTGSSSTPGGGSGDPVQQGEVSSSRPTILTNEVFGPLLLEALEGFLFVVNGEGRVEHVTDNVVTYIKFTKEEVLGKSIYNFIHHGDHTKFHSTLLPMTIEPWGSGSGPPAGSAQGGNEGSQQSAGGGTSQPPTGRAKSIDVRLLVKPPDDADETIEEKQQRVSSYETMHISSTQLRDQGDEDGGDNGPCLLCVASRISHRDKAECSVEQFTTKLDLSGRIVGVDPSGVSDPLSSVIRRELNGRTLRELVPHPQDAQTVSQHVRETIAAGHATTARYTLQVAPDRYLQVHTKSKLFKTNPHQAIDTDFIMATHSILSESETPALPDQSSSGGGANNGSVGGPLMTSVMNGAGGRSTSTSSTTGAPATSSGSDSGNSNASVSLQAAPPTFSNFLDNLDLDFPSSTSIWAEPLSTVAGPPPWEEQHHISRPDSRQSGGGVNTPVSTPTPRPPSNPSYSNAPTLVAQSPLASHFSQTASPLHNPATPVTLYNSTFPPYSPLAEPTANCFNATNTQDEKEQPKPPVMDDSPMADSTKLRHLLMKPANSATTSAADSVGNADADRNRDRILKELLNQDDDGGVRIDNRNSPRGLPSRGPMTQHGEQNKTVNSVASTAGNNNMLRQLLNDKSDDDDLERQAGVRKKSELLQQLLKRGGDSEEGESSENNGQAQHQEDTLLRSLGFPSGSPPNSPPGSPKSRGTKRPHDDTDDKNSSQVSSSASSGSELCKRNKMLASLLAKQTPNLPSIPPIPQSVISAVPQEKLPRIADVAKQQQQQLHLNSSHHAQQQRSNRMVGRPSVAYLSGRQDSNNRTGQLVYPPMSVADNNNSVWDNNNVQATADGDPVLSDLLDQVIEFVPDDIMHFLQGTAEGVVSQPNNFQTGLSESMAINIIQKSLMQCEQSVVKGPASPSMSMSGTPPAYSAAANVTSQTSQALTGTSSYPPPPTYPQAKYQQQQRAGAVARPGTAAPQYAASANMTSQLLLHQRKLLHQQQQQEQKRRLLQQQKQQQLLIPSNAAASEINSIQNIDSLLNNTVAPNVSLQRSASVPEQLSPNYTTQLPQQPQRVSQQQPYSPHTQLASPLGQQAFSQATTSYQTAAQQQRLSPQAQQQQQQQQQQFNAQLSPRQPFPPQQQQQQQAGAQTAVTWQQQQQARISVQQNPMLNAQLTRAPASVQQQQQQRAGGGALPSPGAGARHSPFGGDQFPPPGSPGASGFGQTQYLRLQRANSAPNSVGSATQMTGGLGSPRPYPGREHHPHPSMYPPHHLQAPAPPPSPMMYPPDPQYCYGPADMPLPYAADGRGARGGPPPPHMQPPGVPVSVSVSGPTSEFVRQELRAVVGARTAQAQPAPTRQQQQQQQMLSGQQQQAQQQQQQNDLDAALGIAFDLPTGASESPKLWAAMGSDMGSMSPTQPATSRTTMEEARQGDHKSSLLQKLLSE